MDKKLLEILACPACKSGLQYQQQQQELVCIPCRLAYTVRDDIPIMLIDQARKMSSDETDSLRK
ncbi:tetraacyldisaccharide 4'-kinase [Cycloclasticus sp. 46_83_sub15_T18]|nr:tetraacyldisaccharide 4'-kinase [Cycloclasticus sp. 46_83_sub15_T18]OUR82922.1 tetraacyldisaccharide 4'-kinase [Cycloclasticus sp. 46_120_T64]